MPVLIAQRTGLAAETLAPLVFTQIPGVILTIPLRLLENSHNAAVLEPLEISLTVGLSDIFLRVALASLPGAAARFPPESPAP